MGVDTHVKQNWDEGGPSRQHERLRTLAIVATLTFALAMSATLVVFQLRSENAIKDGLLSQARAHAQELNAVRTYVQGFSGIYVPASAETSVNPHLAGIPDVLPTIYAPNGKQYVLQNAPVVARSVSSILARDSNQSVRMALSSLSPINSGNTPDAFTKDAIAQLNSGRHEVYGFTDGGGLHEFRYALGIPMAEKCGRCHPSWVGQAAGNAGATVVRLDATKPLTYIATSRLWTGAAVVVLLVSSALILRLLGTKVLTPMLAAQQQLYNLANKDSLTGRDVRRVGVDALTDEVARASREEQCLTCCMLDLDDFKSVNDELGHAIGDRVLADVGEAIRSGLRPYDRAARVGGEEFLLLLPGVCAREADEIIERVRSEMALASSAVEGLDRPITCSAGIAVFDPPSTETAHELFVRADHALLAAKGAGKNRGLVSGDALLRSASVLRPTCPASNLDADIL